MSKKRRFIVVYPKSFQKQKTVCLLRACVPQRATDAVQRQGVPSCVRQVDGLLQSDPAPGAFYVRSSFYDVVIAGRGLSAPLAYELQAADTAVLVLEKAKDPHSALKQLPFNMRGLSKSTVKAFYRRDMLSELTAPLATKFATTGERKRSPIKSASNCKKFMERYHRKSTLITAKLPVASGTT